MSRLFSQTQSYASSQPSTKRSRPQSKTFRKSSVPKGNMSGAVLAKAVRKELKKQSETKHVHVAGVEAVISSISSGSGLSLISQPYPTVGPEPTQRIGNKVQPVGLSWKGVYWNQYSYPIVLRRIIVAVQDGENLNSDILLNLFEGDGNNIDVSATGSMHDLIRKVNREGFRVLKDDTITLGINNGGSSVEVSKVYCKLSGSQMYRETGSTHAINDRIVVIHLAREADGDESTGSSIEMSYQMDLYYKDY